MKLGEGIRRRREETGLTQEELAERLDVSRSFVARIENGDKMPSLNMLVKIADELNFEEKAKQMQARNKWNSELKGRVKEYVLGVLKAAQNTEDLETPSVDAFEVYNVGKILGDLDDEEVIDEAINLSRVIMDGAVKEGYVKQMLPSLIEYIKREKTGSAGV